jgi:hypothetical protein
MKNASNSHANKKLHTFEIEFFQKQKHVMEKIDTEEILDSTSHYFPHIGLMYT